MTREAEPVEIGAIPELARLAREVARTGQPRLLRENGEDLAVLTPATPAERNGGAALTQPTTEEAEAALATFGGWNGLIDPEAFKRDRRNLQVDDRPQRDW